MSAGIVLALLGAGALGACQRRTEDPTAPPAAETSAEASAAASDRSPPEAAPPPGDSALAKLPGGGQQVRFNLGQSAEYFNALTAFEVHLVSKIQVQGGSGPTGQSDQELTLRQGLGSDFQMDFALKVWGGNQRDQHSSFTAIRKGDHIYFRAGKDRFFRNRATPDVVASKYVGLDGIRKYLDMLQSGSTFSLTRGKYLDRGMRVYKIVASLPLTENPAYEGPPIAGSSQEGEVWVDEISGLVMKSLYSVTKSGFDESGSKLVYKEDSEFTITKIGDVGEIQAPKDYYENTKENVPGPPQVPLFGPDKGGAPGNRP